MSETWLLLWKARYTSTRTLYLRSNVPLGYLSLLSKFYLNRINRLRVIRVTVFGTLSFRASLTLGRLVSRISF